jgi:hypothetical protein
MTSASIGEASFSSRWACMAAAVVLGFCAAANACAAPPEGAAVEEPAIVSREAWGAAPAKPELMQEQKPSEIIIHHTGAKQQPSVSLEVKMRGLQAFSMNPGRIATLAKPAWGDVVYHYYIDVAGRIAEGRDVAFASDAVTNFDTEDRIQIALEGDFEQEQPAPAQLESLRKLVAWLSFKYGISLESISGHSDHDQTSCPGRNLKPFVEELRKDPEPDAAEEKN